MAPSSTNKDMTGPKALLWAYQLRKEHNDLLYRLDEVEKSAQDAAAAQEKISKADKVAIDSNVKDFARCAATLTEKINELQAQLDAQSVLHSEERGVEASLRDQLEKRVEALESRILKLSDSSSSQKQKLEQFSALFRQQRKSASDGTKRHFASSISSAIPEALPSSPPNARPNPLPRRKKHEVRQLSSSSEIPMASAPPGPNTLQDSLAPLPSYTTQHLLHTFLIDLLQSTHTTLAQYIERGAQTVAQLPRRKEGQIVDAFVAGMRDSGEREKFEGELDQVGWTWANTVEVFEEGKGKRKWGGGGNEDWGGKRKRVIDEEREDDEEDDGAEETCLSADENNAGGHATAKESNKKQRVETVNRRSQRIKQQQHEQVTMEAEEKEEEDEEVEIDEDIPPWWINGKPPAF